jgi:hypothetical protein
MAMAALGAPSPLVPDAVCNLDSTAYITDHSAVGGREVAQTIIAAINR